MCNLFTIRSREKKSYHPNNMSYLAIILCRCTGDNESAMCVTSQVRLVLTRKLSISSYQITSKFMLQLIITRRMRESPITLIIQPNETSTDLLKQPHSLLSNRPSIPKRSHLCNLAYCSNSQCQLTKVANQLVKSQIKLIL